LSGSCWDAARTAVRIQLLLRVAAIILALLVDIAASRKGAVSSAGDDDAANRLVGIHLLDRFVQFARQLPVHSAELVGTIEGHDPHAFSTSIRICS
jgi:hypothetical protein